MELSKRLQAIADMVTKGNRVADIGCDHGYVSIYLVEQKISPHVIAMDINKGPLERAKTHIVQYGLFPYIETRLSNGVEKLMPGEADTLLCAGMGGRLMKKILEKGQVVVNAAKELILQPQSELFLVRQYLRGIGFCIVAEDMVYEEGKYYPMMRAVPVTNTKEKEIEEKQKLYDAYGKRLLNNRNPVLQRFLLEKQKKLEQLQAALTTERSDTEKQRNRVVELENELKQIKQALLFYEGA